MTRTARHTLVPNANSPHLLARLLEMVGRGVRSTRGLQESLGVEARTVLYYTQAGQWLALLEAEGETALTPMGLEYVYAGKHRPQVYARAVFAQPMLAALLAQSGDKMPSETALAEAIVRAEPDLAAATVKRRVSALRSLIAPALKSGRPRVGAANQQLFLPFAPAGRQPDVPSVPAGQREHDPDTYRFLLSALLDHGELALGQVRALLDHAGAREAPIGGYVDLALSRGDARRLGERLVLTADGAKRRDLAESTSALVLSDPGWRAWIDDALAASQGEVGARSRRDQKAKRYSQWDRRLFGHPLSTAELAQDPQRLQRDLAAVLLDRPLSAFPLAGKLLPELQPVHNAFLDAWEQRGLLIACPPSLTQVQAGVTGINRLLKLRRSQAGEVGLPDLASLPQATHGGLFHPGEPPPQSVPDTRTLRLRTLLHAPYPALLTALLLVHRHRGEALQLKRWHGQWQVIRGRIRLGGPLDVIDRFAAHRGWVVSRRARGGLTAQDLLDVLASLGIAAPLGDQVVLTERFFGNLQKEAEEQEIYAQLSPLADAFEGWAQDAPPADPEDAREDR